MSSLTRLERSYYAVGSSSTKSGIFDYLFEGLFVIPPPSSKLGEIGEGIRSKVIDMMQYTILVDIMNMHMSFS